MWRNLLRKIGMWLVMKGLRMLYKRVDRNNDSKLSMQEIKQFAKDVRKYLKALTG